MSIFQINLKELFYKLLIKHYPISDIISNDLIKIFRDPSKFKAVLTDSNGNLLDDGTSVYIRLDGAGYTRYIGGGGNFFSC